MTKDYFYEILEIRKLVLTENQKDQFHKFFELLVQWNERMNLTGITDEEEVYLKHFYDSLEPFLIRGMKEFENVCDVGTGAGFPGIPLAIVYPESKFVLIDSLNKRIEFLNFCINELQLKNVVAKHVRAEEFALEKRESFDLVTSRAVAKLSILAELCAPLVKVGGMFIALKGPSGYDELIEANDGPEKLGLRISQITPSLIKLAGERLNIYYSKAEETPKKYPRQFGQIKKNPLT